MQREQIASLLEEKNQQFCGVVETQNDEYWDFKSTKRWSTSQHVVHIVEVFKVFNTALSYPNFILRYRYGTRNREIRSYDQIIKRYHEKLELKEAYMDQYYAKVISVDLTHKKHYLQSLIIQQKKLSYKLNKISEKDLDTIVLPHHLMGKLPLREYFIWLSYHIQLHTQCIIKKEKKYAKTMDN